MSDNLATDVADFVAHKRALGRKYRTEEATLRLLLVFCDQHGVENLGQLTPSLVEEFIASRPRERARSFNNLVGAVGCFLDWAVTQQRVDASPLHRIRRRETDRRLPFIFDATQARLLLETAAALPDNSRATGRGPTYHTIFALCYGLGLRAGEVCGLLLGDVDVDRKLLVVRGGKFGQEPSGPARATHRRTPHPPARPPTSPGCTRTRRAPVHLRWSPHRAPRHRKPHLPQLGRRVGLRRPRGCRDAPPSLPATLLRRGVSVAVVSRRSGPLDATVAALHVHGPR
jgi:integrase